MKRGPNRAPGGFLQSIPLKGPFDTLGIDYMGPFQTSRKRNKYLLVAVDHLTKWVETRPVRAATSANACHFLFEQIVLRHGAPSKILTDRGLHFVNKMMSILTKLIGIEHLASSDCNPLCSVLTERMNFALSQAIKSRVSTDHKDWEELVPYKLFCVNTS